MDDWQRQGHALRRPAAAGLAVLLAAAAGLAVVGLTRAPWAGANDAAYCYAIGGSTAELVRLAPHDFDVNTNELTIGSTGTAKSDALTLQPRTGVLFAVNTVMTDRQGYLGTVSPLTGAFMPRPEPFGQGDGELGQVNLYDVSGLAFDPLTGWLYAVHVRVGEGEPDALFLVDPLTGRHVPDAFGPGQDYAALRPLADYPDLWDVDDIAIDPATGQMYGVINNSWSGDRLIRIDKQTGAVADAGPFGVAEVEGLSFDRRGRLWATAGGAANNAADKLYEVDLATGAARRPRPLNNSDNYEGLTCQTPAPDLRVALSAEGAAAAGGVVTYTLTYANLGNQQVSTATLTQTLSASTTLLPAGTSPGWTRLAGSGSYRFLIDAVSPGEAGEVRLAVRVEAAAGGLAATAVIGMEPANGLDLNPVDNRASVRLASASDARARGLSSR